MSMSTHNQQESASVAEQVTIVDAWRAQWRKDPDMARSRYNQMSMREKDHFNAMVRVWEAQREAEKPRARVSLMDHLRAHSPGPYLDMWHVGLMIEYGQAVLDHEILNLLVSAPPRSNKSRVFAQGVPACVLVNDPTMTVMTACASIDLVRFHSSHTRRQVTDSGVHLTRDQNALAYWNTRQNGAYKSVTTQAPRLGFGFNLGIIDDPFDGPAIAESLSGQMRVWEWYQDAFMSRLEAKKGKPARVIVNHQALARGDLRGRILDRLRESPKDWTYLMLKGYSERHSVTLPACVTLAKDPRADGEPLYDDPKEQVIIRERRDENPSLHRAIDQQDPMEHAGGGIYCRTWFPAIASEETAERVERPIDYAKRVIGSHPEFKAYGMDRIARGWDFSAGGADGLASTGFIVLNDPAKTVVIFDQTVSYPAQAQIENAIDAVVGNDGRGVEQIFPKEPSVGSNFSHIVAKRYRKQGVTVKLAPQRDSKRLRSKPFSQKAGVLCAACHRVVVAADLIGQFSPHCECSEPRIPDAKVWLIKARWNDDFRLKMQGFTGEDGNSDDVADSLHAGYNLVAAHKEAKTETYIMR